MPLYSDSNYYYSGGSSPLYSPYYPSTPFSTSTTSPYPSYSSTYNRPIGGTYCVPITSPRSPSSYTTAHSLSTRYQPKLCTITETSPLISSSRHGIMPLTRIQSPKYSVYSTPSTGTSTVGSKYIPPRPIQINTADIDVSSARYRKRKEADTSAEIKQSKSSSQSPSPSGSIKKRGSIERPKERSSPRNSENNDAQSIRGRSTIRRNRPVVRLSTIRSRSKDRQNDSNASQEPKFHDLPHYSEPIPTENLSWRQRLAEDLASIPAFPIKKSPGELMRERYLIQDHKEKEVSKKEFPIISPEPQPIEQVIVALDPLHQTIRRLSLPKFPTFHDICEDISSDKIDDDLNAGELRRRASLIQEQEQELLNQLQKSASGTFQLIHLERRGSHDSQPDEKLAISGKRKSRKSKKVRHKITAFVDVENPMLMPVLTENENDEIATTPNQLKDENMKPKFTFNVDSVEEHDQVNKIFKLPKKKSIKKTTKMKATAPVGAPKIKGKPKNYVSTAEIFTFSQQSIEANQEEMMRGAQRQNIENVDQPELLKCSVLSTPKPLNAKLTSKEEVRNIEPSIELTSKIEAINTPKLDNAILSKAQPKQKKEEVKNVELPEPLKTRTDQVNTPKIENAKLSKLQSQENKQDVKILKSAESIKANVSAVNKPKPVNAVLSIVQQQEKKLKTPSPPKDSVEEKVFKKPISPTLKSSASIELIKVHQNSGEKSTETSMSPATVFQSSLSLDIGYISTPKEVIKELGKAQSLNTEQNVATPKPIRKGIEKSESGEDFWSQIDSRETIYMEKRKKSLHEIQWKKVEEGDTPTKELSSPIIPQKQTLPKTPIRKISPEKKAGPLVKSAQTTAPFNKAQKDLIATFPKNVPEVFASTNAKTIESSAAINTATSPKINVGQKAKSPEHQKNSTAAFIAHQTPINNIVTSTISAPLVTSTILTTAKTPPTTILATTTTNNTLKTTISADKRLQPEVTTISKVSEGSKTKDDDLKSPVDRDDKSKQALTKPKLTSKYPTTSPPSSQSTPSTPINADQFITIAPPPPPLAEKTPKEPIKSNVATSPKNSKAKKISSPVKAVGCNNQQKTKTTSAAISDIAQTTTPTISSNAATISKTTTTIVASTSTTTADISSTAKSTNTQFNKEPSESNESSSNLSKFATVSNLAQCLRDVDADIEDYISDISDVNDSSLSDISSPDGCENLSASMKKKLKLKKKKERKAAEKPHFDPQKKVKIDVTNKCYVKEEKPRFPLVATPRPLWRREKIEYSDEDTDDSESESGSASDTGSTEESTEESEECTTSEEYDDDLGIASGGTKDANKDNVSIIRMSTCSNDSGFEGGTAPSSPKKMLECEVNCHKKCERLTANLCGVNQKLIVEALAHVKRGAREARDSPSTPPSLNPAYKIDGNVEEDDETSHTYTEFQKSGRFTAPATVIPKFKNYCVDDFHFLAVLGKGSFGKVLLAELRDTSYYYAVKCLKKDVVLEDDDVDSTLIERKVLALGTKHPYLCHLFCTFQTESHLFFVMEYLNGGDLMFHIQESGRFTEERARFYGAEIISGLKFLHKKGIIYRDLKLDNVLLDYEGHVRIADFGMCKLQIYLDKTADSFCGTPDYMAPEIIKGEKYNQNVDWWSFGVLLYEMLIGQSPFSGCDEDELFWSICNEIPWFPVYISGEALSILKGLLEKDSSKRIGTHYSPAGDVVDHKFFRPIDWALLEKRELKPPFRPQVKHPLDTQYFDRVFTKERVRLTPIDKDILQSMDQKQFLGFTYTNPHITLD